MAGHRRRGSARPAVSRRRARGDGAPDPGRRLAAGRRPAASRCSPAPTRSSRGSSEPSIPTATATPTTPPGSRSSRSRSRSAPSRTARSRARPPGAAALDTLVVAPAGNDGPAGPAFGSLSGPGGAPAALTVGAADLAPAALTSRLVVRDGLHVLLNRDVPVLASDAPSRRGSTLRLMAVVDASNASFFTRGGMSRVAGSAVVVPAGRRSERAVATAAAAPARRSSCSAARAFPRALSAARRGARRPRARRAAGAARDGTQRNGRLEVVAVGRRPAARSEPASAARIAGFSSWGLGFGGDPKPEVAAPGVGVVTVDPGVARRTGRRTSWSSTAPAPRRRGGRREAAVVAQARPGLTAAGSRAALVGTADRSRRRAGRGAGERPRSTSGRRRRAPRSSLEPGDARVRPCAAARVVGAADVDASQRVDPLAAASSSAWLRTTGGGVGVDAGEAHARAGPGRRRAAARVGSSSETCAGVSPGRSRIAPLTADALRVPWAVVTAPGQSGADRHRPSSRRPPSSPRTSIPPSLARPARPGQHAGRRGSRVEPVLRLDIRLRDDAGKDLGLLARLRDVLPGRYAFGLTGRGPNGGGCLPGAYSLTLLAFPAAGGRAGDASVVFTIR